MPSVGIVSPRTRSLFVALLLCLAVLVPGATCGWARNQVNVDISQGIPVRIDVNHMASFRTAVPFMRALVVNEKIAEIYFSETQTNHMVWVAGKEIGTTQLTLWGANNRLLGTYTITVQPDVTALKRQLYEIFPHEHVLVHSAGNSLTLSGTVSSATKLDKILALAEAFLPEKKEYKERRIINLLQVGGVQQVMLEVRVAEVSKSIGHQLGVDLSISGDNGIGLSILDDNARFIPNTAFAIDPNASFTYYDGHTSYSAQIDALQEDGLVTILARPTLIAQSGQSATFLAGGEFPFPVINDNDVTIEWKKFGVALSFTPTVLGDDRIALQVTPEVSDLDYSRTVSYGSYILPAMNTRRVSTMIELGDNQSFAIGGLLKNNVGESISKFPVLGDIPVLGALFRSTSYQKDDTELVVVVTPHLVKPVDGEEIPLPTDSFISPTPFELLMLGKLEHHPGNQGRDRYRPSQGLEGDFGHIIPE